MKSKKSPDYKLQIKFHVSGTISENRDDRTFNLEEGVQPTQSFGFDITFDNSKRKTVLHTQSRHLQGLNRAAKLNNELLSLLFNEEHS